MTVGAAGGDAGGGGGGGGAAGWVGMAAGGTAGGAAAAGGGVTVGCPSCSRCTSSWACACAIEADAAARWPPIWLPVATAEALPYAHRRELLSRTRIYSEWIYSDLLSRSTRVYSDLLSRSTRIYSVDLLGSTQ